MGGLSSMEAPRPRDSSARYRARHPERIRARQKAVDAHVRALRANSSTWGVAILPDIRARARRKGLVCTITAADIIVPEFCPILGIKLEAGTGLPNHNSPSVDRVDNTKGYTPDNIQVISRRANLLKNDATIDELRLVLAYITKWETT